MNETVQGKGDRTISKIALVKTDLNARKITG